jgi:hypothetical protein
MINYVFGSGDADRHIGLLWWALTYGLLIGGWLGVCLCSWAYKHITRHCTQKRAGRKS